MKKIIFILICFVTQNSIGYGQKDNIQYCYFIDNQNVIEKKTLVRYPDIELSKLALLTSYSAINSIVFIPDSTVFEKVSLKINFTKNTINEKRFAKKVLEGDISLYVLGMRASDLPIGYLTKSEEVYIVKKDTQCYTLTNFEVIQDNNKIKKENKYYGILNYLLRDKPDVATKLESTDFDEKSLIKLISLYNISKNPQQKPILLSQKSKTIIQSVGIGTDLLYYGSFSDQYNAENINFNIGVYYNLKYPHLSDRTSLLLGTRYTYFPKNPKTI